MNSIATKSLRLSHTAFRLSTATSTRRLAIPALQHFSTLNTSPYNRPTTKMASILASATATAHAAAVGLATIAGPIKAGSTLPSIELKMDDMDTKVDLSKLEGKNIIITVPAAFSPSCSDQVPAYMTKESEFTAKGVKGIYVVSVNDMFAMKAWKTDLLAKNKIESSAIHFIADDTGAFSHAAGLIFDATPFLGGPRAKRSAVVADGAKVSAVYIEDEPPMVTVSSADSVLATL